MKRSKKGVSAAISIAILLPVVTMTSMLLLNLYLQSTASQQAALRQAELAAEEGKKYLRLSALRGPANETLINLYGAGKLPITIDYILVQLQNDTILVDRGGNILTVNPGENITLTPSQLHPRLAPYDLDYWKAKREIKQFILHTSDGNSLHLSWGPWGGMVAATYSTNTATTITSSTTTTTTITQTATAVYYVRMDSTSTVTVFTGTPDRYTTTVPPAAEQGLTCTVNADFYLSSYAGNIHFYLTRLWGSCSATVSYGNPPYSLSLSVSYVPNTATCTISSRGGSCTLSFASYPHSYVGTCYFSGCSVTVPISLTLTVTSSDGRTTSFSKSCNFTVSSSSQQTCQV
ncbi:MAG: hypothetical protein QXD47_08775 [Candidatus Caldarchaeum sp.]